MPRGKGRRTRDPSGETGSIADKSKSSWAVEADQSESMEMFHRFMLEHMGHGLAPGSVSGKPRSDTAEREPVKAAETVASDRYESSLLKDVRTEASNMTLPQFWPPSAEEKRETKAMDDGEALIEAVQEAARIQTDESVEEDIVVKTMAPGAEASVPHEYDIAAKIDDAEDLCTEAESEDRAEMSPIALWSSRLSNMEHRNQELFEQQRRHILQSVEYLMDEAMELRALMVKGQQLSVIALPQVQQELEPWFTELRLRFIEIDDELKELLEAAPDLRGRLLSHPGAELWKELFAEPRSPQPMLLSSLEPSPAMEEAPLSVALPESRFDASQRAVELRSASLDEMITVDTVELAEGEGSAEAADGFNNGSGDDDDSDVVAWIDGIKPVVEFAPGLTLRSTAPPVDDLAEYRSAKAGLVVSGENHIDWRDLLYSDATTPQGAGGQSHLIFKAIGGGNELGGACYMLELVRYHRRILIDAGLRLRESEHRFPDLDDLPKPDLIVITHAHLDHCGALPHLVSKWPDVPIWCHSASVPLIQHSLQLLERQPTSDSLFVAPEVSLYSHEDVEAVVLEGKETETPYRLFRSDLNLTFYPAGHAIGAVSFAVEGPEDSFFFTGEYAVHDEPSVPAAVWPEQRFDVVVTSCSGFAGKVYDRRAMQERLIEKIAEIIADKAWAVFPIAEIGRAQDIFQLLATAMQSGRLAKVPIYWDGAQRRLAMLYGLQFGSAASPQICPYLEEPGQPLDEELRASLDEGPGILLANPGFLQDVTGRFLLVRFFRHPGSAVFLPMRPDSPLDLKPLLNSIRGDCELHYYTWPSHPSEGEMAEQLLRFSPQAILLVHGTQDIQCNLRAALPAGIIRRSLNNGETLRIRSQNSE